MNLFLTELQYFVNNEFTPGYADKDIKETKAIPAYNEHCMRGTLIGIGIPVIGIQRFRIFLPY